MRALALGATVLASILVWSVPASAETFIAYGTGLTRCDINIVKQRQALVLPYWNIHGTTDCTVPIAQTAQALIPGGWGASLCSVTADHCYSGEPAEDDGFPWVEGIAPSGTVEYHVTLRAPNGQGWLGAPFFCSGVGTDNLKCVFTAPTTTL